jgi:hypothetical protein
MTNRSDFSAIGPGAGKAQPGAAFMLGRKVLGLLLLSAP